jgi:hypothetical protein
MAAQDFTGFLLWRSAGSPYCKIGGMPDDAGHRSKGGHMKKLVLLLVAAAVAASPALAETKHKKKMTKEEAEAADIAKQHDNTRRAVRDALPLVLPTWSLPIFFGTHMDDKLHKM